jgi:alkanesulfonate monooxygenase SsuD/methylene tetrahydromethanopterin reductase-like flavin-dependent oxidoreductase (luciferase family)
MLAAFMVSSFPAPPKVYVAQRNATIQELRERIRIFEGVGVTGVLASDHLFVPRPGDRAQGRLPHEPITMLTTIAALSDRLQVGTIVSNVGFLHPVLVLRQFAQMAALFGGERIIAGLGAGWSRDEFAAIGTQMPPHVARVERLEEAARLAREMFDTGVGNLEGAHVVARDLPLAPRPEVPPRVLIGGGSDRLLEIAGRYADILDLNGSSRRSPVAGKDLAGADLRRRLATTVDDLADSVRRVRAASQAAGRAADAVSMTLLINNLEVCPDDQVDARARAICEAAGLDSGHALDDCPYVMLGSAERIRALLAERRERLQVDGLILTNNIDPRPLCELILPRL